MKTTFNLMALSRWVPVTIVALVFVCVLLFAMLVLKSASKSHPQALAAQEQQSASYNWKLVTTWPKNFPGLGLAPENFARLVNEMSDGRFHIQVHGANEIVPAMGVFDAVSSGSVQMGHSAAYYWKGKIPAAVFFTSVPFGLNAQEFNGWLHYGGGLALWREIYEPFNLVPLVGGSTGVQMGGWFNKEINTVDDLKGLKMRIPGVGGEVFTRAGGTAVTIPGGELYTALQSGVIDATEWVGPYNDLAFGFHQIAKHYYYPGWQEPGAMLEFIINKDALETLPADLQRIIEVAARAINQDMLDEYTARNNAALKELRVTHKVDIRPFPDEVLAHFKKETLSYFNEVAANDPVFEKVYRHYSEYQQQVREYHAISEEAYYRLR